MYSSLSQFKSYLGINEADTSKDAQLTMYLQSAYATINKICGVDSFNLGSYEEDIDARKIYINSFGYNIFLKNKPIASIDKINGINYDGVKGSDYMISQQRRAIFKKFDNINDFGFVTINYTAGYNRSNEGVDELPDDLKMLEMMVACGYLPDNLKEEFHVGISSYKLGDEQIVFGARNSANTQSSEDMYFSFSYLIDKYKNFNLAI